MKCVSSLLIVVLTLPLIAQSPASKAGDAVFKTSSKEVLLDVVVRDKKGNLVKNLKQDEVQVTDDGAQQKILSFRFRTGAEISTEEPATATPGAKPAEAKLNPAREIRLVTLAFDRLGASKKPWNAMVTALSSGFIPKLSRKSQTAGPSAPPPTPSALLPRKPVPRLSAPDFTAAYSGKTWAL